MGLSISNRVVLKEGALFTVFQMPNGNVNLSKIWQVPLELVIKEHLREGKLMSALNMVQATGKGYKELIEYQLR